MKIRLFVLFYFWLYYITHHYRDRYSGHFDSYSDSILMTLHRCPPIFRLDYKGEKNLVDPIINIYLFMSFYKALDLLKIIIK